jgi:hypothetical protein
MVVRGTFGKQPVAVVGLSARQSARHTAEAHPWGEEFLY